MIVYWHCFLLSATFKTDDERYKLPFAFETDKDWDKKMEKKYEDCYVTKVDEKIKELERMFYECGPFAPDFGSDDERDEK